jgi:hypothetical protein
MPTDEPSDRFDDEGAMTCEECGEAYYQSEEVGLCDECAEYCAPSASYLRRWESTY